MNIREPFDPFDFLSESRHEEHVWRFGLGVVLIVAGIGLIVLGLRLCWGL